MDFVNYKKLVGQLKIGKKLPDAIYLHETAMASVPHDLHAYLFGIIGKLDLASAPWNIIKFRNFSISQAFPEKKRLWQTGRPLRREFLYQHSLDWLT